MRYWETGNKDHDKQIDRILIAEGQTLGMLSTCNEGHAPVKILHWRCIQIVHCWDVEMIDANFLHEATRRDEMDQSPATSSLREGAATDVQPSS